MKKRWLCTAAVTILMMAVLAGCGQKEVTQDFYAMDTAMNIRAYGSNAQDAVNQCVRYINQLEQDISRTREDSDIYALNHAQGDWVELSEQTTDVLEQALRLAEETEGCFDPTIAPLSDLWGIGTEDARIPAQAEIDTALELVNYQNLQMNGTSAALPEGACIDLGGIGKGYAADQVAQILRDAGVERAVITLGGNIYVLGEKEDGVPWTIGITDPDSAGDYFATLQVSDTSVVTSGDYERYFEQDGERYCHIFDPETGWPAQTDLRSVTVVSECSTDADAYTTALFVMGSERAMEFCEAHDIEAVFVKTDHVVYVTEGLRDKFSLTSSEYTYEE